MQPHQRVRVPVIFLQTAALMTAAVRRTPDDARKAQSVATLPGLWQEKRLIGGGKEPFSLFMTALVDAYGLGYVFVAGFRAGRAQVCKTLTGTQRVMKGLAV
jgi:hypothetical protein